MSHASVGPRLAARPGIDADVDRPMGFCFFNNVADRRGRTLARASAHAVVDIDVHHGNGTQAAFYADPCVLYMSTHSPFYPGTGPPTRSAAGDGWGFTVNVPMDWGSMNGDHACGPLQRVVPILEQFRPELLLVSAGIHVTNQILLRHARQTDEFLEGSAEGC